MAIKVGGTEVIDNSLGLKNIASIDATTATAISDAGIGGGGAIDFVATGAISNGDLVGLNADGTVSVIQSFVGSETVFESAATNTISATFDTNSNKVVIAYRDIGNSSYGTAIVGTVSGTSISFGTPVVFNSNNTTYLSATFDSNSNKVVIAYRDSGGTDDGTAIVGTVSGTSISFGSPTVFDTNSVLYLSATFDNSSNKVVISYMDGNNSSYGTAIVGTVSGTSISFGTKVVFETAQADYIVSTFDTNSNKVVISYRDVGNSLKGTAVIGTVSGTSISFGTPAEIPALGGNIVNKSITFDSNSNKVVIAYQDDGKNDEGYAVVGTVSGTSISFGTPVAYSQGRTTLETSITFDSNSNKIVIAYEDDDFSSNTGFFVVGTVIGTSIAFDSPVQFKQANFNLEVASQNLVFDSSSNKAVLFYIDDSNSNYGTSIVFDSKEASIFNRWVGIAAEAISDTATGSVNIVGGVNEGQTGLTTGAKYYLQDDATISTTVVSGREIGLALSATKLLITQGSIA